MYIVEGGYARKCLELGCEDVLLIDSVETPNWQKTRLENPRLDFYKGDFANPQFMASFQRRFDIGIVYDVLLHQAPLIGTLHLILSKIESRICIVQPMLREQPLANALIYLPGNPNKDLYPVAQESPDFLVFDASSVNHGCWLWGMTVSFLTSVLTGEGFRIVYQAEHEPSWTTPDWLLWGCVAERGERNPNHWSSFTALPGLKDFGW